MFLHCMLDMGRPFKPRHHSGPTTAPTEKILSAVAHQSYGISIQIGGVNERRVRGTTTPHGSCRKEITSSGNLRTPVRFQFVSLSLRLCTTVLLTMIRTSWENATKLWTWTWHGNCGWRSWVVTQVVLHSPVYPICAKFWRIKHMATIVLAQGNIIHMSNFLIRTNVMPKGKISDHMSGNCRISHGSIIDGRKCSEPTSLFFFFWMTPKKNLPTGKRMNGYIRTPPQCPGWCPVRRGCIYATFWLSKHLAEC